MCLVMLTARLLLGFLLAPTGLYVDAACNSDNCLRALFPTASPSVLSADAAFCATYTKTVNTKTTGFPTRATAACGTAPARYSSACSCQPTTTTTLTASTTSTSPSCTASPLNNVVKNGGFECGLSPWIAKDQINTTHSLSSPGDDSPTAYRFTRTGSPVPDAGPHPANVSQNLTLAVGAAYTLTFRAYIEECAPGFIGVKIGGDDGTTYSVVCGDYGSAGTWFDNTVLFNATSNPENLRFDFPFDVEGTVAMIDRVVVVRDM